jgi:hypothetical protein
MNVYTYKPYVEKFQSYSDRNVTHNKIRPPNDIAFSKLDPTNNGPLINNIYYVNSVRNYDHLNNPYDRLVNPNFIVLPYCKPYWTQREPNDAFGRPISQTYLGYNLQKK